MTEAAVEDIRGWEPTPDVIAAEEQVLGAVLAAPIADDMALEAEDFWRPAHRHVWAAVRSLTERGNPVDIASVARELQAEVDGARQIGQVHELLFRLYSGLITASNATYHADTVREAARLRRLYEAGTYLQQLGSSPGDVDGKLDRARDRLARVEASGAVSVMRPVADSLTETLEALEADATPGLLTGLPDLDEVLQPLLPGQLIIVAGRPGMGKALAVGTPLPTPTGWTTMGEVVAGDWLLGADGGPTQVLATSDVMANHDCYELRFSDGSAVVADAGHQWVTSTRAGRRSPLRPIPAVRTTAEIAQTLRVGSDQRANHAVAVARPFALPTVDLPVDPYVLGVWLGDGTSRRAQVTTVDAAIQDEVERRGYPTRKVRSSPATFSIQGGLQLALRHMGLLQNKHVPRIYLRASEEQRRDLLAGLLDTDGTCETWGTVRFSNTNKALVDATHELACSLGYQPRVTSSRATLYGKDCGPTWDVTFTPLDKVFRLTRKLCRQSLHDRPTNRLRYVVDARRVPSVPVKCVQVDNPARLFLAGRACIPTHNSVLLLSLAASVARQVAATGGIAAMYSLEMGRSEVDRRLIAQTGVPLSDLRPGADDHTWGKASRALGVLSDLPLHVADTPDVSLSDLRAYCRRERSRLRLLVVDYLQLMGTTKAENRQNEVAALSRGLKLLAKSAGIPVVVAAQLNRASEHRQTKRPQLADLRESGAIEQDADVAILLHREEYYDPTQRPGEVDAIVAKQRNGVAGVEIPLGFQGAYSRIVPLARRWQS